MAGLFSRIEDARNDLAHKMETLMRLAYVKDKLVAVKTLLAALEMDVDWFESFAAECAQLIAEGVETFPVTVRSEGSDYDVRIQSKVAAVFGREAEMATALAEMGVVAHAPALPAPPGVAVTVRDVSCVALTGVAGSGKTTLALNISKAARGRFPKQVREVCNRLFDGYSSFSIR